MVTEQAETKAYVYIEPCGRVMFRNGIDTLMHYSGYFVKYNNSNASLQGYANYSI